MPEKLVPASDAPKVVPKLSPSEEYQHNAITAVVLLTALMGFFSPRNKKAGPIIADTASTIARNYASKSSIAAASMKPSVTAVPMRSSSAVPPVEPIRVNLPQNTQEYRASHQQSQMKEPPGILDTINDSSNQLNSLTAQPHQRILGLSMEEHTAVEIVEAYKRKAVECNPEIFKVNDPARRQCELDFMEARNSFRLLMKYKEALSKQGR